MSRPYLPPKLLDLKKRSNKININITDATKESLQELIYEFRAPSMIRMIIALIWVAKNNKEELRSLIEEEIFNPSIR